MQLPEPIAAMMKEHETLLALLNDFSNGTAVGISSLAEQVSSFLHCLEAHVDKEETLLFPCIRLALGNEADALDIIEVEHASVANLRGQFSDLAECLRESCACERENRRRLAELTELAGDILPPHIFKEDNVLYPLASQIISREKLSELAVAAGIGSRTE